MSMKRRQSMDPKFGSHQQQPNCFPGHSKQYSSQHSTGSAGWRSKLGSFLKKGNGAQPEDNAPKIVTRGKISFCILPFLFSPSVQSGETYDYRDGRWCEDWGMDKVSVTSYRAEMKIKLKWD